MSCEMISAKITNKDIKVICFDSIDSTSSYLRRLLNEGEKGIVLAVAKQQTAGSDQVEPTYLKGENYHYSLIFYFKTLMKPSFHGYLFFWDIFFVYTINVNMNFWTFFAEKF